VSEREHTAMQLNQSAASNAIPNQSWAKPNLEQLPSRNHPVLALRQLSDQRSRSLTGQRIAFGRQYVPNTMRCGVEYHAANIAHFGARVARASSWLCD
jgi:hypothetical protein